jgi:hypothetical protein
MKRRNAEELHYLDENGKRQDMLIHEPMLMTGDDDAAAAVSEAMMRREGFTDEQIDTLLGKNPKRKMKVLRKSASDRAAFMSQCVSVMMAQSGGSAFEAYEICELLWEEGQEIFDEDEF